MSALVRKIIVDSRAFLNNAPAQSGTFELPEIVSCTEMRPCIYKASTAWSLGSA